jgi:predicted  nucleic acid-binding Zn-ribbon protein
VNPQLELLIMLQDLDLMIHDLDQGAASREAALGFSLEQHDTLVRAREDLAARLERPLMAHYRKLHDRFKRAVVPVKNNVCLACFLKQPTQYSTEQDEIRTCENCSRILYVL